MSEFDVLAVGPGLMGLAGYRGLADLPAIGNWGARAVITLLEPHEMEILKLDDLPALLQALGLAWWPWPVPDGEPPEYDSGRDPWLPVSLLLKSLLTAGGRVLIHCWGGHGRTGTLAARILIENGLSAEQAMEAVRKARPGSIETHSQEEYLRRAVPLAGRPGGPALLQRQSLILESYVKEIFRAPARFDWPAGLDDLADKFNGCAENY